MSSASSNQSVVHDRVDYEVVYPSGHKDQESPSEERNPSASSPSSTNEDMEMADPEDRNGNGSSSGWVFSYPDPTRRARLVAQTRPV